MLKPERSGSALPAPPVRVWDLFVRSFHWALVGCVLTNFFIVDDGEWLHQWLGYAASALVLARVVWGFVGVAPCAVCQLLSPHRGACRGMCGTCWPASPTTAPATTRWAR